MLFSHIKDFKFGAHTRLKKPFHNTRVNILVSEYDHYSGFEAFLLSRTVLFLKNISRFDLILEHVCLYLNSKSTCTSFSVLRKARVILVYFTWDSCIVTTFPGYKVKEIKFEFCISADKMFKQHTDRQEKNIYCITLVESNCCLRHSWRFFSHCTDSGGGGSAPPEICQRWSLVWMFDWLEGVQRLFYLLLLFIYS